jgi:hypothetical protein
MTSVANNGDRDHQRMPLRIHIEVDMSITPPSPTCDSKNKKPLVERLFCGTLKCRNGRLFGGGFAVFFAEFFGAALGIDHALFAGVERVRSARNVDFNQRVFFAVRPLSRFFGLNGRHGQNFVIARHVFEDYGAKFGMEVFFHRSLTFREDSITYQTQQAGANEIMTQ